MLDLEVLVHHLRQLQALDKAHQLVHHRLDEARVVAHGRKAGTDFSIVRDMPALVAGASLLTDARFRSMLDCTATD